MRKMRVPLCGMWLAAVSSIASNAYAQPAPDGPVQAAVAPIDASAVPMPNLAFTPDAEIERNYFKYFFFHRGETAFEEAYADLRDCDDMTRGIAYRNADVPVYYPYAGTVGGAVGGAVANVMAEAIFGSAERRRIRRINMRTCMGFKGYAAFGLPRNLWYEFNFDEGNTSIAEDRRQEMLRMQARAATGPRPQIGEMAQ